MGNPEEMNHKAKDSTHLNISRLGLRGRKSVGSGRSLMRMMLALMFAAGFCLAVSQNSAAAPTPLGSTLTVDGTTAGGNTLPNFPITSGANRILIVTVDDEASSHVSSVMLGSSTLFTYVGGYAEPNGAGNSTSMWVILDDDLPADGNYDIVVSGGNWPSVAAMLWSGLRQNVPTGSAIDGTGQVLGNQITTSVVVPEDGSLVVGTSGHGNANGWAAAPAGWTRQWDILPNSAFHAGATRIVTTAGLVTLTETCGLGDFNRAAQFVAAFAPELDLPPGCPVCVFRRPITIPPASLGGSCGGDVTNFPVLISIENDNGLKLAAGKVQNASGYDIAFTDSSGNPLYHELELYDGTLGTMVAWVKVPTLSSTADTIIYLYYGDSSVVAPTERPAGVWDSNYHGVWHLNQAPTDQINEIVDSTSSGNHGTSKNMSAGNRDPGKIGYALNYDGVMEYVSVNDSSSLQMSGSLTVEGWIKLDSFNYGGDVDVIVRKGEGNPNNYQLAVSGQRLRLMLDENDDQGLIGNTTLSAGTWYHVVGSWDGSTRRVYLNGVLDNSDSRFGAIGIDARALYLGGRAGTDLSDGLLDEIRISNSARSACWVETEYGNQNDPGSFYNLGTEELQGDYTISASAGVNGLISPAGQVSVVAGAEKTFTVTPDSGYQVSAVYVDSNPVTLTNGQYTFSDVNGDHQILAAFELVSGDFNWSEGSFGYRKQVSISSDMLPAGSCSTSLTNYPVLIKIDNDSDLQSHVLSTAGYDIVFKLADGTPLNHEVEAYDDATGTLVAWVRIPSLSNSTDTNLYMYYGNASITGVQGEPTWVWDFANYEGVWHLNESPDDDMTGSHLDATSNALHGTPRRFQDGDGGTTAWTGLMAGADKFAAAGRDIVQITDAPELNPPANMTVEAWIHFNSFKGSSEGILYKDNWGSAPWFSYKLEVLGDRAPQFQWNNTSNSYDTALGSAGSLDPGTWYYLVGVHDGTSLNLYLNGNLVGSDTTSGSMLASPGQLNIGSFWSDGGESPDAAIDEVRIAGVARPVCWIQTSYNNMLNPGAYITVDGEEGQGVTYPITSSAAAGGSISPMGSVTVAEGANKTFTVSPAYGYQVDEVLVDNATATLTGSQYTFTNVTGAHSIAVTFVPFEGDYGWDDSSTFLYRRPLVIAGSRLGASCTSDLTHFPVLVHITGDPNLKAVSESGHVTSQTGDDIVFKSATGEALAHELTHYNKLTGALTAWVRVPALTKDENRTIYMYYGNTSITGPTETPDLVWDVNYVGVWHLDEAPVDEAAGHLDSTSYDNVGTPKNFADGGGGFTNATGKIGGANYFKGDNDWVEVPSSPSLDITGDQITLSAWVKSGADQNDDAGIVIKSNGFSSNYHLGIQSSDQGTFRVRTNGSVTYLTAGPALSQNQWYFVYGIYNGNTVKLYLDGVEQGSANRTGNIESAGTAPLVIGRRAIGDPRYFDGIIDEVRVSNIARTTCWMETEYSNQSDPAAFTSLGAEETEGATHTITASAGANGSISPAGAVTVAEGGSKSFFLVAAEGYQVNTVAIGGGSAESYSGAQYLFSNVVADTSIAVTFKAVASEPIEDDEVPPGCARNLTIEYGSGFDISNLYTVNTDVDENGYVTLRTGNQSIDPQNIVIPFEQEVSVYFMYEGAGYRRNDFGWMLAADGANGTKHEVYRNVNDNNNNGVLDRDTDDTSNLYGDINGDGVINALDNRQVLGTFNAGTELVFYLKVDDDQYDEDHDFGDDDDPVVFHTKTEWNLDTYRGGCSDNPLVKIYYLGRGLAAEGACSVTSNWMTTGALTRAGDIFGLNFGEDDTASLTINQKQRFSHVMVGAPADQPNAWVLGWEDLVGAGDTDHNDMVFIIERETGGTAQLKPAAAITPADLDGNINGVTIGVWDYMPCAGETDITYWLSIDAGENWVEVIGWDEVYEFNLMGDGRKFLAAEVTNWTPGIPAYTYRTRRVDFAGLGLTGKDLIWRADLKSKQEGCEPKIIDMSLDLTVSTAGHIARSTPTVLANVMYSGSMETPALDWTSDELRGHLKNTRIYDPTDPSQTSTLELWDAGDVLKNHMQPGDRKIYIPNVTVTNIPLGLQEQLAVGDGVTTTFSGRLAHYPVLATTVDITDQRETFVDQHTDQLDGSLGGSGWINRFTGQYRLTFNTAPNVDQPITATYDYFTYNTGGILRVFKENTLQATELGLDDSTVVPSGLVYDFNGDNVFNVLDTNWLVNWVRGWEDGNTKSAEKEWVLGAIDHSVPAVATPPASSPWYYGTAFPEDNRNNDNDRKGYRAFRDAHKNRPTVVYVGARDGMLHAFDAGAFRWIDEDGDTTVEEARGLFDWTDMSGVTPAPNWCGADDTNCPNYGTGKELWAFIPANLLPRLKNNYLQGDDQAYLDASPALADVYVNGAWRTVLLSAEGNGGDTIFALDVTIPDAPKFMWEFADPDLFRSRSSPSVAQIGRIFYNGTTRWVAFFVSGKTYDDTLFPSIYVIDIADGSVVEKIALDAQPAGAGGILSGQPTIVDSDGNGYVDRLYIGSDKGMLYKINIPDDPEAVKYGIGHCVVNTDFTDADGDVVPYAWQYQPIYGSPTVVSGNSVDLFGRMTYDIRIFFGTGDSPYYDEDINFADTRYLFYAYRDTGAKGVCESGTVALDWFFELPEGHRIYASAFAAAGNIYFGTSTGETEDPCDMSSNSGSGFDPNAGKLFAFDMNNPNDTPLLERVVGNVLAAPVVEDKHIYVQSVSGDVDSFGSGQYNTKTRKGGIPKIEINWWRELF